MFKDYYEILSIPFDADAQTIKKSYRALSLKWHPDKNPNKNVTEMMQDINEAYKILSNDSTRLIYLAANSGKAAQLLLYLIQ